VAPLDEALVQVALDCSGRPHLSYGLVIPGQRIGTYDTELVKEFFVAVVNNSGLTLHIRQLAGLEFPPHRRGLLQGVRPGPAAGGGGGSPPGRRRAQQQGVLERAGA
jgi:imidazoleglycerol-phosphate dehydratase